MKDISCRYHGGETLPPLEAFLNGAAMAAFAEKARRRERRRLWRIPPDNAPLARAVSGEGYRTVEEYPAQVELERGPAAGLWTAMDELRRSGPPEYRILFALEGPFTTLSRCLPLEEVYAAALEGGDIFARVEEQLVRCGALAAAHGAALFSLADPVASPGLTGADFFQKCCRGPLCSLLRALRRTCPEVPIHLCSALTGGLLACGACRAVPLAVRPGRSYEEALLELTAQPGTPGILSGGCLNAPHAPAEGLLEVSLLSFDKSEVIDYVSGHSSP